MAINEIPNRYHLLYLALPLLFPSQTAGQPAPSAALSIPGPPAKDSTLAYAGDDRIILARFPKPRKAEITVLKRGAAGWQLGLVQPREFWQPSEPRLYPIAGGRVLSDLGDSPEILDPDLKVRTSIKATIKGRVERNSDAFAAVAGNGLWTIRRFAEPERPILQGEGGVHSVSAQFAAVTRNEQLWLYDLKSLKEQFIGALSNGCPEKVALISGVGVLRYGCGNLQVVGYSGTVLSVLPTANGWIGHVGTSADGRRVLLARFVHVVPTSTRLKRVFESILSLGMAGPPTEPTGEIISVYDTRSGALCMELGSQTQRFGIGGTAHADLSPTGKYLAVVQPSRVLIFDVPQGNCRAK